MAHALFNISPVRFFNTIQDHISTVTPSSYPEQNASSQNGRSSKEASNAVAEQQQPSMSHPEHVTLQLTLAPDNNNVDNSLDQMNNSRSNAPVPINVPAAAASAYSLNNAHQPQQQHLNVSNDGFLLTPQQQQQQQQGMDLLNPASFSNGSKDDLALQFDALAVASPNGSYYSPQLLASPNSQVTDQFLLAETDFSQPFLVGSFNSAYSQHSQYLSVGSPTSQQLNTNDNAGNVNLLHGSVSPVTSFISGNNSPNYLPLGSPIASPLSSPNYYFVPGSPSLNEMNNNYLSAVNSPASTQQQMDNANNYFFLPTGMNGSAGAAACSPKPSLSTFATGTLARNNGALTASKSNSNSPMADAGLYFTSSPSSPIDTKYLFPPADPSAAAAFLDMTSFVQPPQDQQSFSFNDPATISQFLDTDNKPNQSSTTSTAAAPSAPENNSSNQLQFIHESFDHPTTVATTKHSKKEDTHSHANTIITTAEVNSKKRTNQFEDLEAEAGEQRQVPQTTQPLSLQAQQQQIKPAKVTKAMVVKKGRKKMGKIHRCPFCQHTSNRANNMKEHIQIHDPNRPKPHICDICSRAFARKHDMNRHYLSCKKHSMKQATISVTE